MGYFSVKVTPRAKTDVFATETAPEVRMTTWNLQIEASATLVDRWDAVAEIQGTSVDQIAAEAVSAALEALR